MNYFSRVMRKAAATVSEIFHPHGSNPWWVYRLPGSNVDYSAKVGDGLGSNVILAPAFWVSRSFWEATLALEIVKGKKKDLVLESEVLTLLQNPNPHYSGQALWMASVLSWFLDGNSYWLKARDGAGRVRELWYIPHWMICPKWEGGDFVTYYQYNTGNGSVKLNPADVVHMRHGLDPRNVRLGISPIRALLREIFNDDEASNYVASLLSNGGVPGIVISPKEGTNISTADLKATKEYIADNFTGDNKGKPLAISAPTEVTEFGFDPSKMNLDIIRNVSEERLCAMLGIPAAVVGFGTGVQQTSVGATLIELHRIAWTNCVIPNQDIMAAELNRSLLPDFSVKGKLVWDRRQVRALQDDLNKESERIARGVQGGYIMVSEARAAMGLDVLPEHEIFLRPFSAIETGPAAEEPLPLPAPVKTEKKAQRMTRIQARILHRLDAMRKKAEKRLLKRVEDFLAELGKAAYDTYLQGALAKALEDQLGIEILMSQMNIQKFESDLRSIIGSHYVAVLHESAEVIGGMNIGINLPDATELEVLNTGGKRAQKIDLTNAAKERAFKILQEGREAGEGPAEIAAKLRDAIPAGRFLESSTRAALIARTETRYAQNVAALAVYRSAEGIDRVRIIDARLGPTDEDCEELNGQEVSFEEAQILIDAEHPNGTRDMVPVIGGLNA